MLRSKGAAGVDVLRAANGGFSDEAAPQMREMFEREITVDAYPYPREHGEQHFTEGPHQDVNASRSASTTSARASGNPGPRPDGPRDGGTHRTVRSAPSRVEREGERCAAAF